MLLKNRFRNRIPIKGKSYGIVLLTVITVRTCESPKTSQSNNAIFSWNGCCSYNCHSTTPIRGYERRSKGTKNHCDDYGRFFFSIYFSRIPFYSLWLWKWAWSSYLNRLWFTQNISRRVRYTWAKCEAIVKRTLWPESIYIMFYFYRISVIGLTTAIRNVIKYTVDVGQRLF